MISMNSNRNILPVLLLVLLLVTGCGISISRQIQPDRLRYPGLDTISSVVLKSGEVIEFDSEPASHTARAIGDTVYSYVGGVYSTIPLSEIELVVVERFYPVPNPGAVQSEGVSLIKAVWNVFKWSAPVTIPAAFLLALWIEHR